MVVEAKWRKMLNKHKSALKINESKFKNGEITPQNAIDHATAILKTVEIAKKSEHLMPEAVKNLREAILTKNGHADKYILTALAVIDAPQALDVLKESFTKHTPIVQVGDPPWNPEQNHKTRLLEYAGKMTIPAAWGWLKEIETEPPIGKEYLSEVATQIMSRAKKQTANLNKIKQYLKDSKERKASAEMKPGQTFLGSFDTSPLGENMNANEEHPHRRF